ncbi:MAG: 30S ribosomal protein S20 [bacterium]
MANIKSAKKRIEINERNRQRNMTIKSSTKTAIKKVYEVLKSADQEKIQSALNKAYSLIDKAVVKGILHRNTAARKKSLITKQVSKQEALIKQ